MSRKHRRHGGRPEARPERSNQPTAAQAGANSGNNGLPATHLAATEKRIGMTTLVLVGAICAMAGYGVHALVTGKQSKETSAGAGASNKPLVIASLSTDPTKPTNQRAELAANTVAPATSPPPVVTPVAPVVAAVPTVSSGPRIQFSNTVHDFGKVSGGEVVKHTFFFTNTGKATLEVSNVQTSCGCTTAGDWTRRVEPGQSGSIPIQFNTGNFNGTVMKQITVMCNDASQGTVRLDIKSTIWRAIDVAPQFAIINVTTESPSNAATVRIVNNQEEPLQVWGPESKNPAFAAELQTNQPGKEYHLIVRTVPPLAAGNPQGQITLKSSATNVPVISVTAWAIMQQVVVAMPSQIVLPPAPLANQTPVVVSIQNNGTNTMVLSEPAVNAPGVEVRLSEVQPSRFYNLNLTFPAGFEIGLGSNVELSVKTTHPQYPLFKVPVLQTSRPTPPLVVSNQPSAGPQAAGH
jgi:hypothetical protein